MLHNTPRLMAAGLALVMAFYLVPVRAAAPSQQAMQQQQQQMMRQMQQQQQQFMKMIQQQQQQMQRQAQQMQRAASNAARNMSRQAQRQARNNKKAPRPQLKNVVAEFEFVVADDGVVRANSILTPELDEKGQPKKLTDAEKAKLKGDTPAERKLTGYKAGVEDLQPGDEVWVSLSRYVPSKSRKSPGQDEEKDAKKDDKDAKKEKKDADAEKEKAKADDKDDAEKPKAKGKDKTDSESAASDDNNDAHKLANLKDWKVQGKLYGTIVEVDMAGSRKMVIAIQNQQIQMVQPNRNGNNKNNNNNNNAKPPLTSIDPAIMQGTFIVIMKRGQQGGGSGGFGFGAGKTK